MSTDKRDIDLLSWLDTSTRAPSSPAEPAINTFSVSTTERTMTKFEPEALSESGLNTGETTAPSATVIVRRWSDVIKGVPEAERHLILEDAPAALMRGDLTSVPITGRSFRVRYRDAANLPQRQNCPDELVIVDERLTAWMGRKQREARKVLLVVTGKISLPEAAITDPELVREMAELRREHGRRTQNATDDTEVKPGRKRRPRDA